MTSALKRGTIAYGGLDVLDDFEKVLELNVTVVGAGIGHLVRGQLVASVLGDQALAINEPELLAGVFGGHALCITRETM
jgi:ribulose 1,5-bisphosphate synthetase/thiazole synthase